MQMAKGRQERPIMDIAETYKKIRQYTDYLRPYEYLKLFKKYTMVLEIDRKKKKRKP